ncbi:uncharacterized protein [Rutidosis leptorrhynchoides]|uniref:uncharacterized protein n=1 Tax=Rutidosis leptorrhynchoides TaxID=125765 RepID=UPI003A9990FE
MWRSTVFTENENSDQSISEDDDLNEGVHVSLGISADIKGEVQILSQLDMLRDANEVNHERDQTSLSQKSQADTCDEDDVEFPIFANNGDFTYACNSDEDVISDNEITGNCMQLSKRFAYEADNYQKNVHSSIGGNGKDGICTWLAANTESDAFINVKDDADSVSLLSASAKVKRSSKGGLGKTKHKFSIRTHVNNNLYTDTSLVDEIHTSVKEKDMDESKKYGMITELPVLHTHTTTSIAELLDRVQDEHDISKEHTMKYNITEDISEQPSVGRSLLSVDQRYVEDDVECLGSDTSDEDEDNHQVQEHTLAGYKQKTIADQFQEALGAASTNEEGHTYAVPRLRGIGLFGQLQRVMQIEKERDLYSLNNLQRESTLNHMHVLHVIVRLQT